VHPSLFDQVFNTTEPSVLTIYYYHPISDLLDQILKLCWRHLSSVDCSILLDRLHNALFYLWNQMFSISSKLSRRDHPSRCQSSRPKWKQEIFWSANKLDRDSDRPQDELPIGHAYQAQADCQIRKAFSAVVTIKSTCFNTHETIKAKEAFEQHCRDYGVIVQEYLSIHIARVSDST
jgi:hypothetical protein